MLTCMFLKTFLSKYTKWLGSLRSNAYYAYDVRKEGGVIFSFTHEVGGLLIAGI